VEGCAEGFFGIISLEGFELEYGGLQRGGLGFRLGALPQEMAVDAAVIRGGLDRDGVDDFLLHGAQVPIRVGELMAPRPDLETRGSLHEAGTDEDLASPVLDAALQQKIGIEPRYA
jgi:hypothetical protein